MKNVDFIVSLGWQGAALKSASIFNKPLLFYSKNVYPYREHIFSFDRNKNKKINKLVNLLWLNEWNCGKTLFSITKSSEEFRNLEINSKKLIKEIGIYKNDIEDYFEIYL